MASNLMEQYIKNTKNFIRNFTKMFFAETYNADISNELIEAYIDARVYNFGEKTHRFFYRRIYANLLNTKKELENKYEKVDKEVFEDNLKIYQFIFYMDGVRPIANLEEFVKKICEKRKTNFNLGSIENIENRVIKLMKQYKKDQEDLLKKYESSDFSLDIDKYILVDNTYKVQLRYHFKIPYIYSHQVIDEVFNEGIIHEDKLMITYSLLAITCMKDIIKGDFDTKYLVDFANSLFKKQSKLKRTLNYLENAAIQDKVYLKIWYKDFEENKELIYALMQEGFRFAIILDDIFEPTYQNMKKLEIFPYLLVGENNKNYEIIKENEIKLLNTIIYDN